MKPEKFIYLINYLPGDRYVKTKQLPKHCGLEDATEDLAEQMHEVWAMEREAEGWLWGPEVSEEKMEKPCLVAYKDLPEDLKEACRCRAREAMRLLIHKGYM